MIRKWIDLRKDVQVNSIIKNKTIENAFKDAKDEYSN